MNFDLLKHIAHLILLFVKADAPVVEKAAAAAALSTVESDPKVAAVTAASVAMVAAAQQMKAAMDKPAQGNAPSAATL